MTTILVAVVVGVGVAGAADLLSDVLLWMTRRK